MNDVADGVTDSYSQACQDGKKEISRSWQRLRPESRAWLTSTGHYNDHGSPVQVEDTNSEVEELEYNLGLITRCAAARLPDRLEKGGDIPAEASSSEVQSAITALIYLPFGQDPVFLRRALLALQRFEMARLLCVLPATKAYSSLRSIGTLAFCVFCFVLLLITPAILANGLVSAANGNYGDTSATLYALGFIAWMFSIAKNMGKEALGTKDEQTYKAWYSLNSYVLGDWTAGGAGAFAYFEKMMQDNLQVPPVAFDLCESLRAQILRIDPASEKHTTSRWNP